MCISFSEKTVFSLCFTGQKNQPSLDLLKKNGFTETSQHSMLSLATVQLEEYFSQQRHSFSVPLDFSQGTFFQKKVWQELLMIPWGEQFHYSDIAIRLGIPNSVRAVANAISCNPIIILVPCHRIIGKDSSLRGYSAGIEKKTKLLQLESYI